MTLGNIPRDSRVNADMKKLRKELLHGRVRHISFPLGFGGSWTRWTRCRRWRAAPVAPATDPADAPFRWHERLAKLANRAAVR
jgi:hypothetical protein